MRDPLQLFRLLIELIFVLLGGLLIWLAVSGRFLFNPRRITWLLLAGLAIIYGLVALATRGPGEGRALTFVRGGSLILVGVVMLSMAWAPFAVVVWLLIAAGTVLVLRGLIGAAMALLATRG
jgi:hypothetical protein